MKLTLAQPQIFKDSIGVISDLVTEARFNITAQGITVVAMDPANVAMVVFKLFSSSFVENSLTTDVNIALNLSNIKQVFKRISNNDVLTLAMEGNSKLLVTIAGKSTRKFSLPIIELDEREQKIPSLQFGYTVIMPASTLADAIDDAGIISDSVIFSGDAKKLNIAAVGDLSKVDIEIPHKDEVSITAETQDPIRSKFSVDYMKKIMKGANVADMIKIQVAKDYPIRAEFVQKDKVQLTFVLAPRVDND
ncbi:MAG: proliferating cell nuclear antigen (pcna) [Candidatus Woesearchaeota archaeon]